jgi:hypothetical protein
MKPSAVIDVARAILATLVLAVGVPARAQTRPPSPRPSPSASPAAVAPGDKQVTRPPRWALRLRAQESYDSNAKFATSETGSFEDQVGAGLSLRLYSRRGELGLAADGWGRRYHSVEGEDGFNYSGGLSGKYRFTQKVEGRIQGLFSDNVTRYDRQLTDAGLQLPLTRSRTMDGNGGLTFKLSTNTSLVAEGRYEQAEFDDPTLVDGSQGTASASLARSVNSTDRISLNYSYRNIRRNDLTLGDTTRQVHDAFLGWGRTLRRRLTAELTGGASYRPTVGDIESRFDFYGSAMLTYLLQHGSIQARYSHTLGEAYGLGRERIGDVLSAGVTRRLGRHFDGSVGGIFGYSQDPQDPGFRYRTQTATAGLGILLSRDLRLIASYNVSRSRERVDSPTLLSQFGSLSLAYGVEWQ